MVLAWPKFITGLKAPATEMRRCMRDPDCHLIEVGQTTTFERAGETAALGLGKEAEIQRLLTFVLVGAGTVGVANGHTPL